MPHLLAGCIFVTREFGVENIDVGLQMSYNLCNLPKQIIVANGKTLKYTYFADGTKFKAVNAAGNGFAYTGSLIIDALSWKQVEQQLGTSSNIYICY